MFSPIKSSTFGLAITLLSAVTLLGGHPGPVAAAEPAQRIVCIGQTLNEMIYALGAQKDLVGVDLSSTFPPEIKNLPNVGYHRALSAEGILSLKPTVIIHDNNIGPENVVRQLNELQVPMKTFQAKPDSPEGTKALLREMGAYFHKEKRAEELCAKLDAGLAAAAKDVKKYSDHPRVAVIHFGRAGGNYMLVGNGGNGDASTAAKMVEMAGGVMAVQKPGMQRMTSPEIVAQINPDVILMTEYGYDRLGNMDAAKNLPGVAETNAAKNGRIYRVQEHDLMYFGPNTGDAVIELAKLIHKK